MVDFFFDTYAMVEIVKKNPKFLPYADYPLITTVLNKIELYWWALTQESQEVADILLESLDRPMDIDDEVIREAMLFRKQYKKRNISYADAIGYTFAQTHNLKFLTGDTQFADLPGVEFVK